MDPQMPAEDEFQFDVFPTRLSLLRPEGPEREARFYRVTVHRDLFGGASLVREWGRVGCPGTTRVERFADEGHAISEVLKLLAEKKRHGYLRDPSG